MTLDYANLFAPLQTQLQTAITAYWPVIFGVFVGILALTLGPKLVKRIVGR